MYPYQIYDSDSSQPKCLILMTDNYNNSENTIINQLFRYRIFHV